MWWLWLACGGQPDVATNAAPTPAQAVGWGQVAKDVPYFTSLKESPNLASMVFNKCSTQVSTQKECVRAARTELENQGLVFAEVEGRPHLRTVTANDTGAIAILLDTEIAVTHAQVDQFDIQGVPGTESGPQLAFLPADALKSPPLLAVSILDASAFSVTGPDGRPVVYRRKP